MNNAALEMKDGFVVFGMVTTTEGLKNGGPFRKIDFPKNDKECIENTEILEAEGVEINRIVITACMINPKEIDPFAHGATRTYVMKCAEDYAAFLTDLKWAN